MAPLRIVFAGTPAFSVPCLRALLESAHSVIAVYTQPDRPAGRGRKLQASPVKVEAQAARIPLYQPKTLRDPQAVATLRQLQPDLMVVIAYGLLLPEAVLEIPKLGCLNLHASLLPRWRGAAPIQRAILAGDGETGVSLMHMELALDAGPIYAQARIPLHGRETAGQVHDRLAALAPQVLLSALPDLRAGRLNPQPQDEHRATYAKKLTKEEAWIDWQRPAQEIDRQIRAFNPWPIAQTRAGDQILRIWAAEPLLDRAAQAAPGTVLAESESGIEVATGAGQLRITRLQRPGKRPLIAAEFLRAHSLAGQLLG